jgi:integrase
MAQQGTLYLLDGTWYLKYRTNDGANRVHKTERLCAENGEQHHSLCSGIGEHRARRHATRKTRFGNAVTIPPKNLNGVRLKFMESVNSEQPSGRQKGRQQDMSVSNFWETVYLPYAEHEWKGRGMKPSTIRCIKHIWNHNLSSHFEGETLQRYQSDRARFLLNTLKTKLNRTTLTHIKACASGMFNEAVERGFRKDNPWHIKLPTACIEPEDTQHYTLEESENLISALIDHPDCQLFLSLCCFLGLRPSEAIAVKWDDFNTETVCIRRACVNGHVGTSKTKLSQRDLPLIDAIRVPLELWRQKCGNPTAGWVFKKVRKIGEDTPADLHNLVNRVIKPHVKGGEKCAVCDVIPKKANVTWKGVYSARRGFATAVIELTNGNFASAQELLGHSSMETTVRNYKKQTITSKATGMSALQAALTPKALTAGQ